VPRLSKDITYIIAGEGKEAAEILSTIHKHNLQDRVYCLGRVSDKEKELLLCTADVFIQPNIQVAGDMEGFGLVVLEAAMHGLVVIASRLEGLKDAICEGQNGLLVDPGNAREYKEIIESVLGNPSERKALGLKAKRYVINNYSWPLIAEKYLNTLMREMS